MVVPNNIMKQFCWGFVLLVVYQVGLLRAEDTENSDGIVNKLRKLRESLVNTEQGNELNLDERGIDETEDANDDDEATFDGEKRVASVAAGASIIQVPTIDLTQKLDADKVITEIRDELLRKTIDDNTTIVDFDIRKDLANDLRAAKISANDKDALQRKASEFILKWSNVDQPDPEYAPLFSSVKIPEVDKTRTLTFAEVQRKPIEALEGATVDFTEITGDALFSLGNVKLNMKAVRFDDSTVVS